MLFGFPENERRLYRNNFLRTVTFQYTFDTIEISSFKELIRSSFAHDFPRMNEGTNVSYEIKATNGQTPIIKSSTEFDGYMLMSANGLKRINFTKNNVVVTILGNAYRRFEDFVHILEKVVDVLNQIGVTVLRRVSIRKMNIIAFSSHTNNLSSIIADLFAQGIVNSIEAFPQPESLKQNMHSIVLNKDNYRLNLNYGAPEFDNTQRPLTGTIVIDIDLLKLGNTQVQDLISDTTEINNEIYNVFSWVTSDKLKGEIMGYE